MNLINSAKSAVRPMNSNKNKLNSKIIFVYNLNSNACLAWVRNFTLCNFNVQWINDDDDEDEDEAFSLALFFFLSVEFSKSLAFSFSLFQAVYGLSNLLHNYCKYTVNRLSFTFIVL